MHAKLNFVQLNCLRQLWGEFNLAVSKKQFSYRVKRDNLALHGSAKFSLEYVQNNNSSETPSVGFAAGSTKGTPTYATGITPVPLHRGAYRSLCKTSFGATNQSLPCVKGGGMRKHIGEIVKKRHNLIRRHILRRSK